VSGLTRIPTHRGDVLILATTLTFPSYLVALVTQDGQQDCGTEVDVRPLALLAWAVKRAKAVVVPGGRIYLANTDTGDWALIATRNNRLRLISGV
jgi:hypothetical protein